jgi:hypothetical protein
MAPCFPLVEKVKEVVPKISTVVPGVCSERLTVLNVTSTAAGSGNGISLKNFSSELNVHWKRVIAIIKNRKSEGLNIAKINQLQGAI